MKSIRAIATTIPFPGSRDRRGKEELAFLPAALEIAETPPHPAGRALACTIIVVFCAALAWACLGTVDIVATATGKVVPSSRTKVIQPFETGVVRGIYVQDGQIVKAGQKLIDLDTTMNVADIDHTRTDLTAAQLDIARLKAALAHGDDPMPYFQPPDGASPSLVAMQKQLLQQQTAEERAKLSALSGQEAQKEAERGTIAATIGKLEAVIPVVQQRLEIRKALLDHEYGSKVQYLEMLQLLTEQQQDLLVQKSRLGEAEAAVAAIKQTRSQAEAEYRRTLLADLAEAERKSAGLSSDLVKAEKRTKLQALTAPDDGIVQQLSIHTIGGVVTPAQALLVIVPTDSQLEIEAMISNRDIGFVHEGQSAEIKVDTFNFTRYGLLHGEVMSISPDAIVHQTPIDVKGNDRAAGSQTTSSEPKGQELTYAARVSLDRTQMQIDDRLVNLSPGMAVTVEIKTGTRTPISYLLSPIMRYREESLKER
ncbi:MAG TPA: HlyD family type I secretion periplasmic adaptor subunit [Pseudolabrys sp.]|nr:HlyD family type I secretion periplasmic adaptor subunit [Pseudolabrys sp.]